MSNRFMVGWMMLLNAAFIFRSLLHLEKPSKKRAVIIFTATFALGIFAYLMNHTLHLTVSIWQAAGLTALLYFLCRRDLNTTFLTVVFSLGFVYALYIPAIVIVNTVQYLFKMRETWQYYLLTFMVGGIMYLFARLIFRLPRLRNGIPYLMNNQADLFGSYMALSLLTILTIQQLDSDDAAVAVSLILMILLGVMIIIWMQMRTKREYMNRIREREIQRLTAEAERQNTEIDRLSSLLHRDNKLLAALTLAVDEVLANAGMPSSEADGTAVPDGRTEADGTANLAARALVLRQELRALSEERLGTIRSYELETQPLPKTGIPAADMQLIYMQKRAAAEGIHLAFSEDGSLLRFVPKALTETELVTILADLLENAIHATAAAGGERIFLFIGLRDGVFGIEVSDTGVPFPDSVAAACGKGRFTTRADEGGTGIGLETIHDILKKRGGSFRVVTLPEDAPYRKTIRVCLDGGKS